MTRVVLGLLCLGTVAGAEGSDPLGSLIRWYLQEKAPARREDFLEAIERMTKGDARKVAAAIRKGEHFAHHPNPVLRKGRGAPAPRFSLQRFRIRPIGDVAGDYAELVLPREGYDPARAYPLILELQRTQLELPEATILVRINPHQHAQARKHAWAAEALVMSLLAHLFDVVHVDPKRVFLRAEGAWATLAWYIALHNPDRFAGVLGARGFWKEGERIAANGRSFRGLLIEKRGGDRTLQRFLDSLRRFNRDHKSMRAPTKPSEDVTLLPGIREWWEKTARPDAPSSLLIESDRGTAVRSFWIRMAPRVPSMKPEKVGRHWTHRITAKKAQLQAVLKQRNLVEVKTYRVSAFDIFIDPAMFDSSQPLRVKINDAVPEARVIHHEIADLLEDYRERRDPDLLYCCRLTFTVRR